MHLTLFKKTTPLLRNNFKIFAFELEEGTVQTQLQLAVGLPYATSDIETVRSELRYADEHKIGVGIDLEKSGLVCIQIATNDYSIINKEMKEISSKFLLKDVGYLECYKGGWNILFKTDKHLESQKLTDHIRLISTAAAIAPTIGHHIIGTASQNAYDGIKELPEYFNNKLIKEVAV